MLPLVALLLVVVVEGGPVQFGSLPMQNPDLYEGDILGVDGDINDRNAISDKRLKWPGAVVPYVIDVTLATEIAKILKGMDDYHKNTCIKFVKRTTEPNYVKIFAGQGCYSHVGTIGGVNQLSLGTGCLDIGTIVHEFGHAIGFYHEQNRSDRDDYLIIYWDNIQKGWEYAFKLLAPDENILFTPFDYDSIMLYGETAFSKDSTLKTMVAKDRSVTLKETYHKPGLSKSDIIRVKKLYEC